MDTYEEESTVDSFNADPADGHSTFSVPARAYVGGSGTPSDPYIIYDEDDLRSMTSGYYYALGCSIWLEGSFAPIGKATTADTRFSGGLDGRGNTIFGLYISSSADNVGLFGAVTNVDIKNLNVDSSSVVGKSRVGTLVGTCNGVVSIDNCHVSGTVRDTTSSNGGHSDGLVGYNTTGATYISNSSFNGNVTSVSGWTGGLIGWSDYGNIYRSFIDGNINGNGLGVGGIIGYSGVTIEQCYSWASIKNGGQKTGGIVGEMIGGYIMDCHVNGNITSNTYAGGIVGHLSSSGGTVTRCYTSGEIKSSGNRVGGIAGYATSGSTISYCVANNYKISMGTGIKDIHRIVGGGFCSLTRNAACERIQMYYNGDWIPASSDGGSMDGLDVTLIEIGAETIYIERGWDFENVWYQPGLEPLLRCCGNSWYLNELVIYTGFTEKIIVNLPQINDDYSSAFNACISSKGIASIESMEQLSKFTYEFTILGIKKGSTSFSLLTNSGFRVSFAIRVIDHVPVVTPATIQVIRGSTLDATGNVAVIDVTYLDPYDTLTYSILDETIAIVESIEESHNGVYKYIIKGITVGTTAITFTTGKGYTETVEITVIPKPLDTVEIVNKNALNNMITFDGNKHIVMLKVGPDDADDKSVQWIVSHPDIVSIGQEVRNGIIYPCIIIDGTTEEPVTITVKAVLGNASDSITFEIW